MPVIKLLLHSVVSEHKHWTTIDIKDYYLNTPLLRPEFIRIPCRMISDTTIATFRQVSLTMSGYISKVIERLAPHLSLGAAVSQTVE